MQDFLKRAGWVFLAGLFVVTGLGVGVLAFWQATHPANKNDQSQTLAANTSKPPTCSNDPSITFNAPVSGQKLAGTQLADFTPVAKVSSLQCIDVKVGTTGQAV